MQKQDQDQQSGERREAERDTESYPQALGHPERTDSQRRQPRMPHERDESAKATGARRTEDPVPSDQQISKAHNDVEGGLVDTDRRGVPSDVPSAQSTSGD